MVKTVLTIECCDTLFMTKSVIGFTFAVQSAHILARLTGLRYPKFFWIDKQSVLDPMGHPSGYVSRPNDAD